MRLNSFKELSNCKSPKFSFAIQMLWKKGLKINKNIFGIRLAFSIHARSDRPWNNLLKAKTITRCTRLPALTLLLGLLKMRIMMISVGQKDQNLGERLDFWTSCPWNKKNPAKWKMNRTTVQTKNGSDNPYPWLSLQPKNSKEMIICLAVNWFSP